MKRINLKIMKCPTHLSHQPILAVDDYDKIDGPYAHNTDAMALSLGLSQFDGNTISAKVFRNVSGRWSRQSEELPLHRVLDLAILIAAINKGVQSSLREDMVQTPMASARSHEVSMAVADIQIQKRLVELKSLL